METQKRTCRTCGQEQPITEYYKTGRKNDKNPDERHHECKACTKARLKVSPSQTPERKRELHLQRAYGITVEEYSETLEQQNSSCACCKTTEPGGRHDSNVFVVDHCHETGKVRGLLCHNCNTALGLLKDDPARIANLITYLAR